MLHSLLHGFCGKSVLCRAHQHWQVKQTHPWPQSPWHGKAFGSIPVAGSSEAECSWHGPGIREAGKGKGSADLPYGCLFSLNLEIFWCGFGFFCLFDYDLSSHLHLWICERAADCIHMGSSFPNPALHGYSADALCRHRPGSGRAQPCQWLEGHSRGTGCKECRRWGQPLTSYPSPCIWDGGICLLSFVMQSLSHFLQFN